MPCNKRVVVQVHWWFCPEPYGSGFRLFDYDWNHYYSAAHTKLNPIS